MTQVASDAFRLALSRDTEHISRSPLNSLVRTELDSICARLFFQPSGPQLLTVCNAFLQHLDKPYSVDPDALASSVVLEETVADAYRVHMGLNISCVEHHRFPWFE